MGSEHYCLRWNNHQSNLLGVFSQLLQDESLVDVTLACSEGAPIRAHKVVLSACSSYFQSLFLDHPEKHPIVILKDVRFSELQTLVEFMYKGEVNVQYCQLSALLKTAESLKVKGLAEMTNQNTTLREPEREPDRLRPHSQPSKSTCESPVDAALAEGASTSSSSASSANAASQSTINTPTNSAVLTSASTSVAATTANSAKTTASGVHKREPSERCNSPPPTKRHQLTKHDRNDDDDDDDDTPLPLDLYQRRIVEPLNEERLNERTSLTAVASSTTNNTIIKTEQTRRSATPSVSGTSHNTHNNGAEGRETPLLNSPIERPSPCSIGVVEKIEDEDYDEDMDLDEDEGEGDNSSNEMGLNMKIHSHAAAAAAAVGLIVPSPLGDIDSARSTPISASTSNAAGLMPSDLTQRSSTSRSTAGTSNSGPTTSAAAIGSSGTGGGRRSPTAASSSVGAGDTSGLGPVQSVPLSLKKEIDLSEDDNSSSRHMQPMRSASAGGGLSGTDIDYRTTHESILRHFGSSLAVTPTRCSTPFNFPFSPLGLNLFDLDPSRVLGMLHHQSWLADEALRNRGLFTPPKEFPQRLGDFFGKDIYTAHLQHASNSTSDLTMNNDSTTTTTTTLKSHQQQPTQQQYKSNSFNVRYPSMAAFFQHQHQQLQQQQQQQQQQQTTTIPKQHEQHKKQMRQNTPSPHQQNTTATSTTTATLLGNSNKTASPISISPVMKPASGCDLLLEELQRKSDANADRESHVMELSSPNLDKNPKNSNNNNINNNNNSMAIDNNIKSHTFTNSGNLMSPSNSGLLYKESLDQFLQRRRSSSASLLVGDNLRNYSQLLLSSSATTPSCTDTSSCKEKSSSSSTSSTPPPTSALLAQHQHLSQMLKSPSESSLFGEVIEEETRCVVCNAHFPNVWLLEQHAALQHPHIGPGDEKPFICEQCGQSYRYRSAYAKHKEQNHRARLPADKLFTCDVCGMQFRYLKSFKKHRLNHALERLHGKKSLVSNSGNLKHPATATFGEQDIVTSSQETMSADDGVIEDLRIKIKRERDQRDDEEERDEEQDNTIDSAGINMIYNDNSSASASTSATESNITSSDVIYSTNKKHRLLTHSETDPSYHCLQQVQQTLPPLPPQTHLHAGIINTGPHQIPVPISVGVAPSTQHHTHSHSTATATAASLSSLNSLSSITSLINADRIPSEQFLGLNPQEASILNFLRVDAAERQRDKRPQASRFACPFCGKCVRSKENLKLHVRKHTGERPFVCLFCGRAFGGKSDLTRHLRIHTGERPYHCESCGKCFARADYLSKHLTTHIHNAPR